MWNNNTVLRNDDRRTTWKNSGSKGILSYKLCDTGAALQPTELLSQLRAGHLQIRNDPVGGETKEWECIPYMNNHIMPIADERRNDDDPCS